MDLLIWVNFNKFVCCKGWRKRICSSVLASLTTNQVHSMPRIKPLVRPCNRFSRSRRRRRSRKRKVLPLSNSRFRRDLSLRKTSATSGSWSLRMWGKLSAQSLLMPSARPCRHVSSMPSSDCCASSLRPKNTCKIRSNSIRRRAQS